MSKIANNNTAEVFNKLYSDGYNKKYPSTDLVRLESWYFKNKPGKSLDYGCGPGTNGLHLLDSGYNVVFADVSIEAINKVNEKIKKRSSNIRKNASLCLINTEDDHLPFENGIFDYIIALSVLGNAGSYDSLNYLLEEFFRVLCNGGKIIMDINANDTTYVKKAKEQFNTTVFLTRPSQDIESEPILMYFPESVEEFVKTVEKCGFSINDVGYSNFKYINCTNHEYIICAHKD